MSLSSPPPGGTGRQEDPSAPHSGEADGTPSEVEVEAEVSPEDQQRAGEALRASFARLSPQGSDEWNFMGAFTLLGDRFGPYQPGTSELADVLGGGKDRRAATRRGGLLGRLKLPVGGPGATADSERFDFDEAMGHIIEAFRFLHARVSTLESRLGAEDVPLDGAAWLAPARELDHWVEPVVDFIGRHGPGATVVHADCGQGPLVRALTQSGIPAHGVEPRGGVALRAIEHGSDVTMSELDEYLGECAAASLGGLVLSGLVDRLALHALIPLLADCRRALAPGAPLVIVSEAPAVAGGAAHTEPTALDLVDGRSLHTQTWGLLLDRSGFVDIEGLAGVVDSEDQRFGISACVPTS